MTKKLNTMKKILPLVAIVLWVGCESLDFADPNSPVVESASIQSLVTGAEAGMRVDLAIFLRVLSVVGREVYYLEPADPRYTGELMVGPMDGGGFLTTRPWNAHYRVIKNCNLLLDNPDLDDGGSGFAKTIKAYNLLLVINVQDENGARLNYDGDITVDVATKAQVFDEIEALLDAGFSDLQAAGDDEFSFVLSSGFAGFDTPSTFAEFNRAIRARVAVYQDDWAVALTALGNSFLDETGDLDEGVYHVYSTGLNDQENGMYEDPLATTIKLMGHPTFQTDAESGDARFSSKVLKRSEADTTLAVTTFDNLSSDWGITVWSSSTDPVSIIRNEELILLKAEAKIGQGGDGLTEINIVRDAHDLPAATSGGLSQLLHEKRYSLFLEGHRLIDMRHYNKLGDLPLDRDGDAIVTFPLPETETPG
ncbi:MAG: RagB/SusD family nutrient uptake outer membrane protein [Candidatus Marinimicrobia bacterium]|nr:RagB/SusD family nutrient uptake outer membrane protein [Candidatus Neomarinimicrobiota bacterium]